MTIEDMVKLYKRAEDLKLLNTEIRMVHHDDSEEWVIFRGFKHDVHGNPAVVFARHDESYRCETAHVVSFPLLLDR